MSAPSRLRNPNPHLGAYYGIVTSAFVSLIIMVAMFEQLGWRPPQLAETMIVLPLALYLLIAIGARTLEVEDFFVSGRRVPPVFNGIVLAATAVGGVGFLAYTGTVFFLGFDVLAIGVSEWTAAQLREGHRLARELRIPLVSNQPQYNMLWRVIEGEVVPPSQELGIGQIVWSPIAQGVLTGKYQPGQAPPTGSRAKIGRAHV